MLEFLPYIAMGMKYGPQIIALVQSATSNQDLVEKISALPVEVMKLAAGLGGELFPGVKKELQAVAGAVTAFDHSFNVWVQKACNMLLPTTPKLVEDGIYGPLTRERVKILQKSLNLQAVDGWVGKLTRSAIDHAVALLVDNSNDITTPAAALELAASMPTATAKPV